MKYYSSTLILYELKETHRVSRDASKFISVVDFRDIYLVSREELVEAIGVTGEELNIVLHVLEVKLCQLLEEEGDHSRLPMFYILTG